MNRTGNGGKPGTGPAAGAREALLLVGSPEAARLIGDLLAIRAGDIPSAWADPDAERIAGALERLKRRGAVRVLVQPLASFLDRELHTRVLREVERALNGSGLRPDGPIPSGPDVDGTNGKGTGAFTSADGALRVETLGPLFSAGGASEQAADRIRDRFESPPRYRPVEPREIQPLSFDMIERSLDLLGFPADSGRRRVVVRAVHATADFSLAGRFYFTPGAVEAGRKALADHGTPVITDVNMVSAGIGSLFSGRVLCRVADPDAARLARETGLTRSAAALEMVKDRIGGSVVAVGNAPTALVHLLSLIEREGVRPALIVGVPVGLVGAAESKELLVASGEPCITVRGNRGGSTVASAVVNALGSMR